MTRRTAIFAHYDADGRIDDFVLYYLRGLAEVAQTIVFVSDGEITPAEIRKLSNITEHHVLGRHGEYDFGSYKRGFFYARDNHLLEGEDEIILCNDSCYGPIYPLRQMFAHMDLQQALDGYGVTLSRFGIAVRDGEYVRTSDTPHLQSYFLVLRPSIFQSQIFAQFLQAVHKELNKTDIVIHYEIGFSQMLRSHGFRLGSYVPEDPAFTDTHWIFRNWKKLILQYSSPFLKYQAISLYSADYFILHADYPVQLISRNLVHRFGWRGSKWMRHPILAKFLQRPLQSIRRCQVMIHQWTTGT